MAIDVHLDGLTLSVASVRRSMKFYSETLGFKIVVDAAPDFALVRVGGKGGGTIGLLALRHAVGGKAKRVTPAMRAGAHVELSTSDLDGLYEKLMARGVSSMRLRTTSPGSDWPGRTIPTVTGSSSRRGSVPRRRRHASAGKGKRPSSRAPRPR